ncbi:MAG TPA: hypothetical protein VHB20_09770 [Verrucomicrobiae bacterium]|nr:hypothetical protein [Verrucomicrobiae bacterium]
MNLSDLQTKLLRAARQAPPRDTVPYAFEKRIMHRLASAAPENPWAAWGSSLWRGALACMAVTILCAVWSYSGSRPAPVASTDFSQDLQSVVFASMGQPSEDAW